VARRTESDLDLRLAKVEAGDQPERRAVVASPERVGDVTAIDGHDEPIDQEARWASDPDEGVAA
jgi:hypothetical protein